MREEFSELLWQHVGIGYKIEEGLSMLFLHFDYILAEVVFPCYFITGWKMIDFLVLI